MGFSSSLCFDVCLPRFFDPDRPEQGGNDPDHGAVPVPVLNAGPVQPPAAAEPGTSPHTAGAGKTLSVSFEEKLDKHLRKKKMNIPGTN